MRKKNIRSNIETCDLCTRVGCNRCCMTRIYHRVSLFALTDPFLEI